MAENLKIIKIPHPSLREVSTPVAEVDKKLLSFIASLEHTLLSARNPRGVGLAGPQVNKGLRIFVTDIEKPQVFINPAITKHSATKNLGENKDDPIMEGCLSMPGLYGPVFRFGWVELEYDQIKHNKLERTKQRFTDFHARVIQHELDHLNGILFTDRSLSDELMVFRDVGKKEYEEVERELLELY